MFWRTFRIALLTTLITALLGAPEAYILNRMSGRWKSFFLLVILGPNGPATLIKNPGEQGCCSEAAKLAYGNSWSKGPFSCQSSTKGLTCTGSDGHGFFVSKAKVTVK